MKKKLFMYSVMLMLFICTTLSVSYAWWISGDSGNSVIIQTANIKSKISLFKGNDFNLDGYLDKVIDSETNEIVDSFEDPDEAIIGEVNQVVLKMTDVIPTEIYTWKIEAKNMGDAKGYLKIAVSSEQTSPLVNDVTLVEIVKFYSIIVIDPEQGELSKVYFDSIGNSLYQDNDPIDIGETDVYVFKVQLETFDDLLSLGKVTEDERTTYNALQGRSGTFLFLDVILTSE